MNFGLYLRNLSTKHQRPKKCAKHAYKSSSLHNASKIIKINCGIPGFNHPQTNILPQLPDSCMFANARKPLWTNPVYFF